MACENDKCEKHGLHHERSVELNKKRIKEFEENYPEESIPDPFNEDFSLPLALQAICVAIKDLMKFIEDQKKL